MPKQQQANAQGQPREGQPLLDKWKQVIQRQPQAAPQVTWRTIAPISGVRPTLFLRPILSPSPTRSWARRGSLEGGHSVPLSRVTRPDRLSVSDLPTLHGPPLTVAPPRQLSLPTLRSASPRVKFPPLPPPAAASGSSPRGTAWSGGPMASGHLRFVPHPPQGTPAAGRARKRPSLARRMEWLWQGSVARQDHRLPPVQPTHGVLLHTGTQLAWRQLGHTETGELSKVQEGHGGNTYRAHFRGLTPHPSGDRSIKSTCSPERSGVQQEAEGTHRPAEQTAHRKQLRPETEDALMQLMRKKREELEEQEEDKTYAELFGDIFSMDNEESLMTSSCIRRDPPSPTLEPAAAPLVLHSTCSVTKDTAGETQNYSELPSLDQLLADLGSVYDDSPSFDTLVKKPMENWEQEELPGREAAEGRDSEPESALSLPLQHKEAEPATSPLDRDPWDERHSQPLLTSQPEETSGFSASPWSAGPCEERSTRQPLEKIIHLKQLCTRIENAWKQLMQTEELEELEELEEEDHDKEHGDVFGDIFSSLDKESPIKTICVLRDLSSLSLEPAAGPWMPCNTYRMTKDTAGETQNYSVLVSPDRLRELWSDQAVTCDALLNELQGKWEQEELPDREAAGERDSESESALSLPPQDKEAEPAASALDSDPCDEGHSNPLPTALTDAAEEAGTARMEPGRAQAAPPQEKPCGAEAAAGPCPVPARPLPCSVPSSPAGTATVPRPPAPRPWRSIIKTARRVLCQVLSFGCLRGSGRSDPGCQHPTDDCSP